MTIHVSADRQRAVSQELFGLACYRLVEGVTYRHDGIVGTPEDAEAYLRGEDVPRIQVHTKASANESLPDTSSSAEADRP